jgi:hypothetical protein
MTKLLFVKKKKKATFKALFCINNLAVKFIVTAVVYSGILLGEGVQQI